MIIFLYGPDDYRRLKRKREIISDFLKKHSSLGLGSFDGDADGAAGALPVVDALAEFARSRSIFENAKLAIIENAFELDPEKLAKILAPLAAAGETTVLISEKEKPVKTLAFLVKAPVRAEEFKHLAGAEWLAFIKVEAKKIGLAIADDAARFLGTVYQNNPWALVTELQKLSALVPPSRAAVVKSDFDRLDLEAAPNYWALLNGLKSIDGRVRLTALETLFSSNDPPPKIFNILAAQAGEKIPRMAEYDLAVKSGKLEYEEALLDLTLG